MNNSLMMEALDVGSRPVADVARLQNFCSLRRAIPEAKRAMHNGSLTGSILLDAASRGNGEAVWQIAANEPYADLAYTNPRSIWPEVLAALKVADEEMAVAIGCCLLEHMLEVDFAFFQGIIAESMPSVPMLAEAMSTSAKFGQSRLPSNSAIFDALKERACRLRQRP